MSDNEPTYENQLRHARKLLREQGCEALRNPHGYTGDTCGCGECFCCAASQVLHEHYSKHHRTLYRWLVIGVNCYTGKRGLIVASVSRETAKMHKIDLQAETPRRFAGVTIEYGNEAEWEHVHGADH